MSGISREPEHKNSDQEQTHTVVHVWDPLVRIFHWTLALLIVLSWYSVDVAEDWMEYHMWSGYAVLTLVLLRIGWGFIGTTYARFGSFLHSPRAIAADLFSLHRREGRHFTGHTPLGGINIVLLLLCLLVQAGTGLFANDDVFTEGPLYRWVGKDTSDWLTMIHYYNFNVLLALIGLHIAAVFYHLIRRRENLIAPMLTGRKKIAGNPVPATKFRPGIAATLFGAAALAVYLLIR